MPDRSLRVWTCPVCGTVRLATDVLGHYDPNTGQPCPAGLTNPHTRENSDA